MYVTNPSNFGFILTSFGLHDIFYNFSITCNGKMANVTYLLFSSCSFLYLVNICAYKDNMHKRKD